ncbi:MAG: hypothetical protein Q8R39_03880 [bacterium]|nr:hypothetical protein [bacterium]MDZ4285268.1 hypothetical protein [Patescibacteria group bacterium]
MAVPTAPYRFRMSERAIYAEIFFPKKVVYMSRIYLALEASLKESVVKRDLTTNAASLLVELQDYTNLFDPNQYRRTHPRTTAITVAEAHQRIARYRSVIAGWSIYEVDGVYRNPRRDQPDDELTQVVRLVFRPENHIRRSVRRLIAERSMGDVLQAMIAWAISDSYLLAEQFYWHESEEQKFMTRHEPWPQAKRAFALQYYKPIMRQLAKWIDDCALLVFGFLVRRFWREVVRRGTREDEIWVTSFFNLGVNRVVRQ